MKETIIIVEGAQGVGKTTVTDYLRNKIPYTNLYRLSGNRDTTSEGYNKAKDMYDNLLNYMATLENKNINMVFDRTFFSEEVYSRLGYKEYLFTPVYKELLQRLDKLDFDIYYIVLYLEDINLFENRLKREGKTDVKYVEFNIKNSIDQQNKYLELADEVEKESNNIKVLRLKNDFPGMATDKIDEIFKDIMKK